MAYASEESSSYDTDIEDSLSDPSSGESSHGSTSPSPPTRSPTRALSAYSTALSSLEGRPPSLDYRHLDSSSRIECAGITTSPSLSSCYRIT